MRPMLEEMASLPQRLADITRRVDEQRLDTSSGDEWSARVVLAHLRDEESSVFRLRVERMVSEDEPVFAPFPPESWLEHRRRDRDNLRELLADLALQRKASVNLLSRLTTSAWARAGHHPDRGRFTVESWVDYWLQHDRDHVAQVERLLA